MAHSKTYLNVPYAEKDAAKTLGAKWDAASKKWYAPANVDITLFAQWQLMGSESLPSTKSQARPRSSSKNVVLGVVTHPKDKDFIAYSGDEAPWK